MVRGTITTNINIKDTKHRNKLLAFTAIKEVSSKPVKNR